MLNYVKSRRRAYPAVMSEQHKVILSLDDGTFTIPLDVTHDLFEALDGAGEVKGSAIPATTSKVVCDES
jgi:hypothetical protein